MRSGFDYHLSILDLNLPKLDGVSVLRHLRSKPGLPTTKVVDVYINYLRRFGVLARIRNESRP